MVHQVFPDDEVHPVPGPFLFTEGDLHLDRGDDRFGVSKVIIDRDPGTCGRDENVPIERQYTSGSISSIMTIIAVLPFLKASSFKAWASFGLI